MKKLLLTLVFSVFYVSSASAEMGFNVGVSERVYLQLLQLNLLGQQQKVMVLNMVKQPGDQYLSREQLTINS